MTKRRAKYTIILDKIKGVRLLGTSKYQYFKTRIKVLRAEKDITQEELAEAIGVSRTTILEIERGTFNPSLKLSFKIANYFNKKVDEVFTYIEEEDNEDE